MFKEMRVRFCKQGAGVFFSHLDLTRAVQRAMRRGGVPFWSTGGFSPRPYCVFAQPLSLGYESRGELFDFRLIDETAPFDPARMKEAFPVALEVQEIYEPRDPFKAIAYAAYTVTLRTEAAAANVENALRAPMPILKKTKRSETEADLRDYLRAFTVSDIPGGVLLTVELAAGNERNLSPSYLKEGLERAGIPAETKGIRRDRFLKADGTPLR